ncbi:hypothetical protein [Candidatus Cyanaurora vandensis]|uniref:hypothetical protein n=1 Tax=Candidatus Cyanaurora vandensis TaxID=2714958 RepID=UPI00257B9B85|nr:hypothetical protein [Candidatus Cyanaurora vandensis]
MANLIINLGTSDISVKVQGEEFFFPVMFNRNEPNDTEDLTDEEIFIWRKDGTTSYIATYICPELGIKIESKNNRDTYSFRDLTQELLTRYQQDPDHWHSRIRPCRVWGVIQDAVQNFAVTKVYFIVTNQPEEEVTGRLSDTVHLFELLKLWFNREEVAIEFIEKAITFKAIHQDELFNYYYKIFTDIPLSEEILVSIKGGTNQMQTALKMQAIATGFSKLLFIDPELKVSKFLRGEPSGTKITSFWKYTRTQRYQNVNLLLERWDFGGALIVLEDWQRTQRFLNKNIDDPELFRNSNIVASAVQVLELACDCLELNQDRMLEIQKNTSKRPREVSTKFLNQIIEYDKLLNVYTQCLLYWKLNRVANFLYRLSTFYDLVLYQVRVRNNSRGPVLTGDRFQKRAMIEQYIQGGLRPHWEVIAKYLDQLNFWVTIRNELVHDARGVVKEGMRLKFEEQKQYREATCQSHEITTVMTKLLQVENGWLLQKPHYLTDFVDKNRYYLYAEAHEWVIQKLMTDGLA